MSGVAGSTKGASRKVVCYQDSMHPWIKSDQPGKCTICAMDLTPIYDGEKGFAAEDGVVVLNSNSITVLNVQAEEIKRQPLRLTLRAAGTLDADESRKVIFSAPAAGRIHEMMVGAVGDEIETGKPLLNFYSPELVTWRRAYVVRSRSGTSGTPLFAGRPHEASEETEHSKAAANPMAGMRSASAANSGEPDPYFSDLLSPVSGTIVERKVFNGQYVGEGDRLLTIVDTSVLWFRFDAYERQLPWLRKGQKVQVTVPSLPGREFSGVISVIEPTLDEATRTVKVRADITNPVVGDAAQKQRLLRLGMYAEATVVAEVPDVLTVPRTAVLFPGGQAYAYVEEGAGAYGMRPVKLGRQGDGLCEVLEGLDEGDRVVTTGNVLIDAQAQFTQPPKHEPAPQEEKTQLAHSEMGEHAPKELAEPSDSSDPATAHHEAMSPSMLTEAQEHALENYLSVANEISVALAADSLNDLKRALPRLKAAAKPLASAFSESHPWHEMVEEIAAASAWSDAKDLDAARATFLPFSTRVVGLVERARAEQSEFRSLKVFHCPMAPQPGLWFQAKGPLRNPYYGAEMLTCGKEVRPSAQPVVIAGHAEATAPQPETAVQPVAPVNTIRTMNNRHPEAKERMARTFGLGVAARHQAAAELAAASRANTTVATELHPAHSVSTNAVERAQ